MTMTRRELLERVPVPPGRRTACPRWRTATGSRPRNSAARQAPGPGRNLSGNPLMEAPDYPVYLVVNGQRAMRIARWPLTTR